MFLIEYYIWPISFEFWFFLLISFSKSYSRSEFLAEISSIYFWILCIFLYFSNNSFFSSLSLDFSSSLAFSICLLISIFFYSNSLFLSFKLTNLSINFGILSNVSSDFLSSTTYCKKSENILCFFTSSYLWSFFSYFSFFLSSS
jgi:hypothetical protein